MRRHVIPDVTIERTNMDSYMPLTFAGKRDTLLIVADETVAFAYVMDGDL